jgi:hypothetical protein
LKSRALEISARGKRANWTHDFRSSPLTYPRLKAFTAFEFTITMSGNLLAASLRRLGGRQNRSESHLPDISTGPEGEHRVRFASSSVHLYSLSAFQRSQTPSPQPKRGIKNKIKELFTSKLKRTSQTHSPALPVENTHPTEVCTDCIFAVSLITNPTGPTAFELGPFHHCDRSSGSSPVGCPPPGNPVQPNQGPRSCNRGRSSQRCR